MARLLALLLFETVIVASAMAEGDVVPHSAVPPPVSISTFAGRRETAPPGFVFLEAIINPERAPQGAYPPKGIAVENLGLANLGTCFPIVKLTVPVERVPEIQALLHAMAPQQTCGTDGWCTAR